MQGVPSCNSISISTASYILRRERRGAPSYTIQLGKKRKPRHYSEVIHDHAMVGLLPLPIRIVHDTNHVVIRIGATSSSSPRNEEVMTRRHTHHSVEKLGDRGPNEHDDALHTLGAVQLLSPRLIILLQSRSVLGGLLGVSKFPRTVAKLGPAQTSSSSGPCPSCL